MVQYDFKLVCESIKYGLETYLFKYSNKVICIL